MTPSTPPPAATPPKTSRNRAAAFLEGARLLSPLLIGVAPFGVIYGVVALQAGLTPAMAMAMSSVVFAGSAQFLLAQLAGAAAPALVMIGAVLLINLRHALYSASVAPLLAQLPARWKILLAYLLTDEAYAAVIIRIHRQEDRDVRHWILLGSGFTLWAGWQLSTFAGIALGAHLPDNLELDFALPLTFIAILVPLIANRGTLFAALGAGLLAVALADLPYKLGMIIAAVCGIVLGGIVRPRSAGA